MWLIDAPRSLAAPKSNFVRGTDGLVPITQRLT